MSKHLATKEREAKTAAPRPKKKRHWKKNLVLTLMLLCGLYNIAVFSNIPFVEKWRTIYIETAMGTMTHQWLATAFIPSSVINKVMDGRFGVEGEQSGMSTGNWSIDKEGDAIKPWKKLKKEFSALYSEVDIDTLEAYMDEHTECIDSDGYLMIDKAGVKDKFTGIKTVQGDDVLAIDTKNGIVIIQTSRSDYVARMAIIKDPSSVFVGLAPDYGSTGSRIAELAEGNGAVLGINGSGFYDPNGQGNGAQAYGLMISKGEKLSSSVGSNYKMIGFDKKDVLNIGRYDDTSFLRDAVEFKPILVLDGDQKVEGSAGWGIQPRSAIGQRKNGEVLLLVVDGRAPGYSIGATMGEMAELMLDYNAYQAVNLDGGSSSVMYYNGRVISKPSAGDKVNGRRLPNGFLVAAR